MYIDADYTHHDVSSQHKLTRDPSRKSFEPPVNRRKTSREVKMITSKELV